MEQVLLLNQSFEPITVINWKRAMCMLSLGKVEVIEEYDHEIKSQRRSIKLPAVVRLLYAFKTIKRRVSFTKNNVFARDKWTCQYCLERFYENDLTLDHVVARARGGKTCWENVVACCVPCNSRKGDRTPQEARMQLRKIPTRPEWISLFQSLLAKKEIPEKWKGFCYM